MTRRGRGMRSCKVCGSPSQRALCGNCSPNRATTEHVDKYASAKEPEEIKPALPLGRVRHAGFAGRVLRRPTRGGRRLNRC